MLLPTVKKANTELFFFTDDGTFPNNAKLPVILYKHCLVLNRYFRSWQVENIFKNNGWGGTWRDGIFNYHHYHSNAHEAMGVYSGIASVQLGGPSGTIIEIHEGDVLLIPAGVAHRNMGSDKYFKCVGAYPKGQEQYDIKTGDECERPQTDHNIAHVALPTTDPVYGKRGPVIKKWLQ